jgi:hypothetical protein
MEVVLVVPHPNDGGLVEALRDRVLVDDLMHHLLPASVASQHFVTRTDVT